MPAHFLRQALRCATAAALLLLAYAIFNWLSPIMTLTVAYFRIKIKYLTEEKKV